MRRPGVTSLSKLRRCNSTSYNTAVADMTAPTTPMSCDGVTLLSLPALHPTTHHVPAPVAGNPHRVPAGSSDGYRTDDPMSTSLLDRNESWSSFSSLHSLPEPFLCRNHSDRTSRGIPDAAFPGGVVPKYSLGITADVNGWHDGRGVDHRGTLVNGFASADPRMQSVFQRPSNGPTNYSSGRSNDSGTLRASSVGREIDSDDVQLNTGKNPASDGRKPGTVRSSSAHRANSVIGHLMRAKSATSKTLRKFGPKFSGSTKSVVSGGAGEGSSVDVKSVIVRRSSSIAQRFKSLRQPMAESRSGAAGVDGKLGPPMMLRRTRERSPLACETPSGHAAKSPLQHTATVGRDQPRRVLFGASALHKDAADRKIPPPDSSGKTRLSFHGRERTASCGDAMTSGTSVGDPPIRPRSTEPLPKSVRIEPTSYLIQTSSPIAIESRRIGSNRSPPASQFYRRVPAASRSPRMASPESSSLSSGSPASVFSAAVAPPSESMFSALAPPGDGFRRTNVAAAAVPSDSLPSMSDLSLWEMPKLDIDLMDSVFVGPRIRGAGSSDFDPSTDPWIPERNPPLNGMSDASNISSQTEAITTHNCDVESCGNVLDCLTLSTTHNNNCDPQPLRNVSEATSTHSCDVQPFGNVSGGETSSATYNCGTKPFRDVSDGVASNTDGTELAFTSLKSTPDAAVGSLAENITSDESVRCSTNGESSRQVFPNDTVQCSSNSVSDEATPSKVSVCVNKDLNCSGSLAPVLLGHSDASHEC